ncbi:RPAP1-like protein [Lipomyces chichibuensis]|uniref:RPAP1-like protein n=1 Tax=Lipomyces chichibuensis TaxID=1546026 RepID=UPI003343C15A
MTMAASISEAAKISEENKGRIAAMTPEQIEAERAALEASLPPGLISRILKRDPSAADAILLNRGTGIFDDDAADNDVSTQSSTLNIRETGNDLAARKRTQTTADGTTHQEDIAPTNTANDPCTALVNPISQSPSTHFPSPVSIELDPSDPEFLELLHKKYFPDLPADPSRLAWMKPVTDKEDYSSPYNPQQQSVSPADIRFDFHGDIIPPSKSVSLPTTLGLHHHSDSPGYAGYTIPELSHLCRSAVPAQRAIAVQVVGRVLYKLGINYYGEYVGDALWDIVEHTRVVESLYEAADEKKTHHLGLRTCAVEALWLWKKGGGRRHKTD